MDNLVLANILHRKPRTFVSIVGVALGVILVVLTVGIVHGFLNEQGRRNAAITAEIMFNSPGSNFGLDLSPTLSMPARLTTELASIEGVEYAVAIGRNQHGQLIDGIDYPSFQRVSDAHIVEGKSPAGDEAIVDRAFIREHKAARLGGTIEIFDRPFRIVGIYEPESLARVKVPLDTMQAFTNQPGMCSMILIKVKDPVSQDDVAERIKDKFPDNALFMTRDLPILYAAGIPALQTFLRVVIAVSILISSLVILLAMYTTVTERTRQIGILKSLGASRPWIASQIEKEALLITAIGVTFGMTVSIVAKLTLERLTPLHIDIEPMWLLFAVATGVLSGVFGALYPAVRAANQDPVKALSYE